MQSAEPTSVLKKIITSISIFVLVVLVLIIYYIIVPANYKGPGFLGLIGLFAPMLFFFLMLVFLFLFVWTRRKKWKPAYICFACSVTFAGVIAIWPTIALWNSAKQYKVQLNMGMAIIPKFNEAEGQYVQTISYGVSADGINLLMDHWPIDKDTAVPRRPVIIKIHGGGWEHGSTKDLTEWNAWFNSLGYHVFDVNYRMPPPIRWLDEVGDIKCALGFLVAHASTFNIDTNRIILMGYSAGANLALLTAYSYGHPKLVPSCNTAPVKIKCVIDLYGPTDLTRLYATTGSPQYVRPMMKEYIGAGPGIFPDRYQLLSPIRHLDAQDPPTIILHGANDRVVPKIQSYMLDSALTKAGIPHEFYLLPLSDHGFDANWNNFSTQIAREKIKLFLEKYGG